MLTDTRVPCFGTGLWALPVQRKSQPGIRLYRHLDRHQLFLIVGSLPGWGFIFIRHCCTCAWLCGPFVVLFWDPLACLLIYRGGLTNFRDYSCPCVGTSYVGQPFGSCAWMYVLFPPPPTRSLLSVLGLGSTAGWALGPFHPFLPFGRPPSRAFVFLIGLRRWEERGWAKMYSPTALKPAGSAIL